MVAPIFARDGSRSWTGSRLVLCGLLALAVIFGILAMHGPHLGESHASDSGSAAQGAHATQGLSALQSPESNQGTTADTLTMQGPIPPAVATAVHTGHAIDGGLSCAHCSSGELSMTLNCLLAVVLGLWLLLPRKVRTNSVLPQLRAGPRSVATGLIMRRAPSLNVLCINRC